MTKHWLIKSIIFVKNLFNARKKQDKSIVIKNSTVILQIHK